MDYVASAVTVLGILGSVASLVGWYVMYQQSTQQHRGVHRVLFSIAGLLSICFVAVPSSWVQSNVRSKLAVFSRSRSLDGDTAELIQRGSISMSDSGEYSIEFDWPYAEKPVFELIANGYERDLVSIRQITAHQVVIYCNRSGWPAYSYRWVARGKPLYKLNVNAISEP